jgi:Omp85 superfamily domain
MRAAVVLCLAAVLLGASPPSPEREAPEIPPEPAHEAAEQAHREGSPWFALPVLFWMPETRLGFGATGGLHYHVGKATRASSVFAAAVYTLERQGSVDMAGEVQLPNAAAVNARVRATHFPDVFYGIGPRTIESVHESFTRQTLDGYVVGEWPLLGGALRAGPRLEFRFEDIGDLVPGGMLASGAIQGAHGFHGVGGGASITYDTRDSAFWPLHGSWAQAYGTWYPARPGQPALDHELVEGRHFVPLGHERVLGVAAFVERTGGDAPFTMLPSLGSTRFLRGFRGGRFRDHVAWSAQSELRVPVPVVASRLSAVAFAAAGDVAPSLGDLRADTIKVAGGAGLRWRLTNQGANIRGDVAVSRDGVEFYLLVLEAF